MEIKTIEKIASKEFSLYFNFIKEFIKDSSLSCNYKYNFFEPFETMEIDTTSLEHNITMDINKNNIIYLINRLVVLMKLLRMLGRKLMVNIEDDMVRKIYEEIFFIFWRLEKYFKYADIKHNIYKTISEYECKKMADIVLAYLLSYIHRKRSYEFDKVFILKEFTLGDENVSQLV